MNEVIFHELRHTPAMPVNFARAVMRARVKPSRQPRLPATGLRLNDVSLDPRHLAAYRKVCGFGDDAHLPPTYPHMHAFPLHMALMTASDFPFSAMGLVHVRNTITQYRPIGEREQLNIKCHLDNLQQVEKGWEFSVFTAVSTGGEQVWTSESVNFHRGGGTGEKSHRETTAVPACDDHEQWRIPGDTGRRYGAVSGDRNPIHLYPLTARLFGFKRQIAHGMWSKARCLAALQHRLPEAFRVDVQFKLPMFIPATVRFEHYAEDGVLGFRLLSEDGAKPHLAGQLSPLSC